ncbi:hypothetical protein JCM15519_36130 [Fundidesulfovibrio butyratiphilus]
MNSLRLAALFALSGLLAASPALCADHVKTLYRPIVMAQASTKSAPKSARRDPMPLGDFETAGSLRASSLLPKSLLRGRDFRVEETVTTDGYVNIYILRSRYGDYRVYSTPLLVSRIDEIAAMGRMEKVSGAKEFGKGVWDGGANVIKGAANLITDPINTLGSTFSGVGKLFERAEESIAGSKASKYEDGAAYGAIGFSSVKRDYAKTFGVDPYSTNAPMQARLNKVASAGYAGGLTSMGLKMLIPGGVGIAVSSVGGVNWLGEVDLALPPTELRRNNREILLKMGIAPNLVEHFIDNDEFTPTQQSLLVKALSKMDQTAGRDLFIRLAARSGDQEQTLFRQRMAQLYSAYDRKVEHVEQFLQLGKLVGAKTRSGKVVLCFPLDRLVWTKSLAERTQGMGKAVAEANPTGVELWICGPASPLARKKIAALGWTLKEHCNRQLLGETY